MQETEETIILQVPPEKPDCSKRYLFYLHGLIVEMAGTRPKSEEHGYYEYDLILKELARTGCIVISEVREKNTQIEAYAEKIANQIKQLVQKGVPAANIIVVGASKGGIIAAYVSNGLQDKEVNYLILAGLFEKCLVDADLKLYGKVLSIHDRADSQSMTPEIYFDRSKGLGNFQKIVLNLDIGHGLIYRPYREWLDPMLTWLDNK
ncbi:MAG: alpha/beta hydrolase [Desulforhopalus sp.]